MLVTRRILKLIIPLCIFAFFLADYLRGILLLLITGQWEQTAPSSLVDLPTCTPAPELNLEPEPVWTRPNIPAEREKVLQKPLALHNFRADGLLEVNSDGPHPIFDLISRAEDRWNDKIQRASKSLDEAVVEYKRRYHRAPPRGFDDWWDYVTQNNVQLPDEYDQIYHDLEPFWGIEPADLRHIQSELESKVDSYTLGKTDTSPISVVKTSFEEGRYDQLIKGSEHIIEILEDIDDLLPAFRATFSPHDGPNRLSDYAVEAATLKAAHAGTYIGVKELPKKNPIGWISACSPTSPARSSPIDLDDPPPPSSTKTFIYDHQLAMDPCLHPNLLYHHGQFLSHNMGPTPQDTMVPEFSYCSTTIHHNIRIPTPYGWMEDILPRTDDPEWDDKLDERLMWRGSNTGIFHASSTRWQTSHRDRLVEWANNLNGTAKVLIPPKSKTERVGEEVEVRKARINPAITDIAFTGSPISCSPNMCKKLESVFEWRKRQSVKEAGKYRYVIDVDGNGWSGRFKRLITSNSLVFKSTIYPEWYTDRIAPWVHYIPVQLDLSDLYDSLIFFRGETNGEGAHEDLARKIAIAGRQWSKTFWRREDLVAYFFRLLLEYARLMSLDREAMSFSEDYEDE